MAGNSFGTLFRFTTWGESHGPAIGVVVDGVPPRLPLAEADIQRWLDEAQTRAIAIYDATRREEPCQHPERRFRRAHDRHPDSIQVPLVNLCLLKVRTGRRKIFGILAQNSLQ